VSEQQGKKQLTKQQVMKKLSFWIYARLAKNLYMDYYIREDLLKLAKQEEANNN
jgi:hypothetical protein